MRIWNKVFPSFVVNILDFRLWFTVCTFIWTSRACAHLMLCVGLQLSCRVQSKCIFRYHLRRREQEEKKRVAPPKWQRLLLTYIAFVHLSIQWSSTKINKVGSKLILKKKITKKIYTFIVKSKSLVNFNRWENNDWKRSHISSIST